MSADQHDEDTNREQQQPEGAPETKEGDSGPAYDQRQAGVEEERDDKLND